MLQSNKEALALAVQKVFNSEQQALVDEIERMKKKLEENKKQLEEARKYKDRVEYIEYRYAEYKTFYHLHFQECPQCKGCGGWDDGHGGGGPCDLCGGQREMKNEDIQKYVLEQIKNNKF